MLNAYDPTAPVLIGLCLQYLRQPSITTDAAGTSTWTFDPPLTTAEQTTFADLTTMARFGVTLTLAEWQTIKPDAAGLKAYLGLASPTNAQSIAAIKAIIRALGVIIRD